MLTVYYTVHAALILGVLAALIWRVSQKHRLEDFGMDAILITLAASLTRVGFALGRAFLAA